MFERIFGWYFRGCAMAEFIARVHCGMACLLAPFCEPAEVAAYIERAYRRDELAYWLARGLQAAGPVVVLAVTYASWMGGLRLSMGFVLAEFGLLAMWTLWGQPFLMLNVHLWRASAVGHDTARLVQRVQPYRVAQAAEYVQQHAGVLV